MKKITLLLMVVLSVQAVISQVPDKFNYQAVVRNDQGEILANLNVKFRLSILNGTPDGQSVYNETQNILTNSLGVASIIIGEGTTSDGSLGSLEWGEGPYYLKVEVDPDGTSYKEMGTSQLISVPYALYSGAVNQPMNKFTVVAAENHAPDSALFEVKDQFGNTLFAVYPEGTRVYVDDSGAKGIKGGFAVGGYKKTKGVTNEYMRITPDSVRIYFEEPQGKGIKGGFAVGGYKKLNKSDITPHFAVGIDSTEVYVNDPVNGGFNVKINDPAGKGTKNKILNINAENSFIGMEAGYANRGGKHNAFLGYKSGYGNTTGSNNVYIGSDAGSSNSSGSYNIFIGNQAGITETGSNRLYIDNGSNDLNSALIYGEFDNDRVRINSSLGIGRNAVDYNLEIEGDAYKTNSDTWVSTSDRRVKENIRTIENAREQIMQLRPVTFEYNDYWKNKNPGVKDKTYYNFVAQEFMEVFPESVYESSETLEGNDEHLYKMSNQPALIVSIKAVQELIEENREQQKMIDALKEENEELRSLSERVKNLEIILDEIRCIE